MEAPGFFPHDRSIVTVAALVARHQAIEMPTHFSLRQAGLPLGLFQQTKIFLTTEEMLALYNAIEEISGDPGIG